MSVAEKLFSGKAELAVVGLGYVGMPLALAFAEKLKVIGFDINASKIEDYKNGIDPTNEVGGEALEKSSVLFTNDETLLKRASFIVVTVPTPVDKDNMPDLKYVISASEIIGRNLMPGTIVVIESTVYTGVTEEICVPIIEKVSGLVCGKDFKVGYSPERINPGDKVHKLSNIIKVVAGMDDGTTEEMSKVYGLVARETFKAKSIKVAEIAKLVENTQRDVNIAFMNELSMIFGRMGLDSVDVIKTMSTKWNTLNFSPGLVGGHCISVDPYYLIYDAERVGFHSMVIMSGRKVNDDMGYYVADAAIRQMIRADKLVRRTKVYILGITYKENCPDIRNSMVFKIVERLREYEVYPEIVDPVADKKDLLEASGIEVVGIDDVRDADCLIFAVTHDCFRKYAENGAEELHKLLDGFGDDKKIIIDVKNIFNRENIEEKGYIYWTL